MKKQLLQKQRGILVAFLGFLCVVGVQAQTWTAPVPVGSVMTTGSQYYVYSVGAKAFLDRGGEWDSQAIVTPYGALITTVANSTLWNLEFENNSAKCLKYDTPITNGYMFTDGAAATYPWDVQITDAVNNVYSIQVPSGNALYTAGVYAGTSSTLYSSNREGTVYDVRYNRTPSNHTKWMFVIATDLAKYDAQVQLDKYMNIAKLVGSSVVLTSYIATYNAGVTADINTAVTALKAALTVTDMTTSILNPGFTTDAASWTNPNTGATGNSEIEFYHKNPFNFYQTVTSLTPGVYMVKMQGFQRPVGLNTAQHTNYTNGSDALSAKFYATASGTTSFIPIRNIYSETTCTVGTTVDALLFPNTKTDAQTAFTAGLYDNELGYVLVDGTGSLTLGASGVYTGSTGDWEVIDNFRLYYYGAVVTPTLSASTSSITFAGTKTSSFSVTGLNQSSAVTLTAPAGITLSTYSIPANPLAVSVDVTYDGTTTVADTIRLSCGALVAKIAVSAHPTLTTSTSSIAFEGTTSSSFTVSSSQSSAVTLTAPTGITLSTYSIPANPSAVTVDVTYDGTTSLADTIRLSCGALVAKIAVKSYSPACFTPLYPSGLLITDPYCNSYLTNGWGTKSINTNPAYVYCGSSSGYINGGSIDRALNGTNGNAQMLPNTTYRVKAMVYRVSGTIQIGVWGWDSGSGDINHPVTSADVWETVDFTFTTAATLKANQGIFFNNGVGYIDNWEMYVIPTIRVAEASVPVMSSAVGSSDSKTIKVSGNGLTAGVSLVLSGANADQFSVSPATLPIVAADSIATTLVSITYTPTVAAMSHVATLTLSSPGAADKTFELSASSSATGVSQVSSNASVSVSNGMLKVNGSLSYEIFTAQGMRVAQSKANGESYSVALKPGVYIIKLDNGVKKVVVK